MKTHLLTLLAAGALLAGCATDKGAYSGNIEDDRVKEGSVAASPAPSSAAASSAGDMEFKPAVVNDYRKDAESLLRLRIVFFDYDKAIVPQDAMLMLQAHAIFLSENPGLGVVLEGHADERGSNEYNLALGQRRADAVREIFASHGVSARQVETLSFGEESPRAQGHDEFAWKENRRVEIRYTDE